MEEEMAQRVQVSILFKMYLRCIEEVKTKAQKTSQSSTSLEKQQKATEKESNHSRNA